MAEFGGRSGDLDVLLGVSARDVASFLFPTIVSSVFKLSFLFFAHLIRECNA